MLDRDFRLASGQAVQKPDPVMPGRAPARVVGLVDKTANFFEGLDVFGVASKGKLDLGLFDHGIDTAQPVRLGVRHNVEAMQRIAEIRQRFAVGPAALRFLGGLDGVIDHFSASSLRP